MDPETQSFLDRLQRVSIPLGEVIPDGICWGIKSGLNEAFWITDEQRRGILGENPAAAEVIRPLVTGESVRRYYVEDTRLHLLYMYHGVDIAKYPAIERHLARFRERLERRATRQEWYELQQPQMAYRTYFEDSKILYPEITPEPRFSAVSRGLYPNNKCFLLTSADPFLLVLLNSQLVFSFLGNSAARLESEPGIPAFLELRAQYMQSAPIRRISEPRDDHEKTIESLEHLRRTGNRDAFLAAVDGLLPTDSNGQPNLEREDSAPVRDALASIGTELTEQHRTRLAAERSFDEWLAFQDWPLEHLPAQFRRGGWAGLTGTAEVLAEFRRRRVRLSGQALTSLTAELDHAFQQLEPIRRRIRFLDDLAERAVRRLYGIQ